MPDPVRPPLSKGRWKLAPQAVIDADQLQHGLQRLVVEAAFSSAATVLTSGVILTAYALMLGATNFQIGLLASAPFLCQLLQLPAVPMIERLRARKAISVLTSVVGRAMLAVMGLAIWVPDGGAVAILIAAQFVLCSMSAIGSCAWNAWLRDLVPPNRLGAIIARRTGWASVIALIAGVVAAVALDEGRGPDGWQRQVFGVIYIAGCIAGLVSAAIVARVPEPQMPPPGATPARLLHRLRVPFRDANFRALLRFLASWQFAINLATPFFTVFLVRQLGYNMTFVMLLSVVSQLANLAVLRLWGTLSDRFAHKSVLSLAAPAYILAIAGMIAASQFSSTEWRTAYLVLLHIVMGIAVAGVTLATASISLKLSPSEDAPAYVASAATATAIAAGIAPILGGAFADFFADRALIMQIVWTAPGEMLSVAPIRLAEWEFYFAVSALIGLYAMHRLTAVREEGEIDRQEMLAQFVHQTRRSARNLSTVAGLRAMTELPAGLIRGLRQSAASRGPDRADRARSPAPEP